MKRKDFLRLMGAGTVAIPNLLNGFGLRASNTASLAKALNPYYTDTDKVLVLIQLNGGNDGLNTVIPLDIYPNYYQARPHIYIPEDKVLKLGNFDHVGIHPAMQGLKQLFDENKLAIVQSVGYPEPNFSHFRATDIWRTASDADEVLNTGWIGRYLKYEYPNYPFDFPNPDMPHPLAIEIGYSQTLTMQGPFFGMGIAIADPEDFYDLVNGLDTPVPNTPAGDQLRYVRLISRQANHYADYIKAAYDSVTSQPDYPDTGLSAQLKIVARLIAGGLQTRIYHVGMGGFDTHDFQVDGDFHGIGKHADLLKELSDGIKAFMDDLAYQGVEQRVLGMTYSEFGRRIISNGSFGTDHGAAAPMFVFGTSVQGGVVGDNPIISPTPSVQDNVPMQHDFRSVYTTFLKNWFCVPEADLNEIMLQDFPALPLVAVSDCVSTDSHERNRQAGKKLLSNYPNPFTNSTNITFESGGSKVILQVFDTTGNLVATPLNEACPIGKKTISWDAEGLPSGVYYCRLQNGPVQQIGQMLKVN